MYGGFSDGDEEWRDAVSQVDAELNSGDFDDAGTYYQPPEPAPPPPPPPAMTTDQIIALVRKDPQFRRMVEDDPELNLAVSTILRERAAARRAAMASPVLGAGWMLPKPATVKAWGAKHKSLLIGAGVALFGAMLIGIGGGGKRR